MSFLHSRVKPRPRCLSIRVTTVELKNYEFIYHIGVLEIFIMFALLWNPYMLSVILFYMEDSSES